MKIILVMPIWGDEHIDLMENYALPSQLSAANLQPIKQCQSARYLFLTRSKDHNRISEIVAALALDDHFDVEIKDIPGLGEDVSGDGLPYNWLRQCQNIALSEARKNDSALVFLTADALIVSGSIGWAVKRWLTGARAVLAPSIQVNRQPFLSALKDFSKNNDVELADLAMASSVGLALQHLHAHFSATRIDSKPFLNSWPSAIWWPVGNRGLVMRAFHLHPLLVHPVDRTVSIERSFDDGFVGKVCPDPADICVATDSNQALMISMEKEDYYAEAMSLERDGFDMVKLISWAAARYDETSLRCFVDFPVSIHAGEREAAAWRRALDSSQAFVEEFGAAIADVSGTKKLKLSNRRIGH